MNNQKRLLHIAQRFIAPNEWPSLRGVVAYWESETLNVIFFFGEKISDKMKEDAEILATEILAQFSEGFLADKSIYLDSSYPLPVSSFWIYKNLGEV